MTARIFAALLALTLIFRAWLAWAFPISGDEAYFIWWGWRPDWGFYDHPPMIGWWLAALSTIGDTTMWLRLPSILQPALLAAAVYGVLPRLVPGVGDERRRWAAVLVLLAPANVWNVFVTTDTPLIYFSVFSALAWLYAARHDGWRSFTGYLLAGAFLAGAVLSKYFAAFLGFAYLIDVLQRRNARAWLGLTLSYACTLPALALMLWWNSEHCWANYMFNFVNRHGDAGWSLKTPLLYALTVLYVLTPPVLVLAWKQGRIRPASADFSNLHSLAWLAWLPFALFAALSLVKQIGLHWLLSFAPLALLWLALRLPMNALRRLGVFFVGFAAVHIGAILLVSRLPLEVWNKTRLYDGIVLSFEYEAILKELAPYRQDWVWAMDGYSNAVTLGYNARRYVSVFGPGSSHARHDDILTDFRALSGRNILILRKTEPQLDDYRPYFAHVAIDSFEVRGARFWRVKGENFNYTAYRDRVLAPIRSKYYCIPAWLPQNACYFCDRYFPLDSCRR